MAAACIVQRASTAFLLSDWLDLSTGISPFGWPVPAIPPSAWHRLPEDDDGLIDAARAYYEAPYVLPVAGSQAAIQALPWTASRIACGCHRAGLCRTCARMAKRAGHRRGRMQPADALLAHRGALGCAGADSSEQSGRRTFRSNRHLLHVHAELAARGGWLLVDEAFMDVTPQQSLCRYTDRDGLIVLRSVRKIFRPGGCARRLCLRTSSTHRQLCKKSLVRGH